MKFKKYIDRGLEGTLGVLFIMMLSSVLWQVFSRYVLNDPSTFTDELARYLLIWVGILGAAYATGRGAHVAVDIIRTKLNNPRWLVIFIQLVIILFALLVLVIGGANLVHISFELGQTSSAMKLPLGFVYIVLPLSGVIICYYCLLEIIHPSNPAHESR
jgi:TRAP-type C4-dicarboxylate transport system permease small subunit